MKVVALVIGNNSYPQPDALSNAVNDAKAMEDAFSRLGYQVKCYTNCKTEDYSKLLTEFEEELKTSDASIFYYAGHGFQEEGENFLPSIECQVSLADKHVLGRSSIRLSELIDIYKKNTNKTHIVILDACRNKAGSRGGGNDSFAPIAAPPGTFIAFSTSPNSSAIENPSLCENSLYTSSLLEYIGREDLAIEELFKRVRRTVANKSNNRQIPWEHTSLISDFYFNRGQMTISLQIPYKECVVKDKNYKGSGQFAVLINEVKSYNFERQNTAIQQLLSITNNNTNKNDLFLLGRNILQASEGGAFEATGFMNSLYTNLSRFNTPSTEENHVLNGILFEIYFNKHGEFRQSQIKDKYFEEVMSLRHISLYNKSFQFIRPLLKQHSKNESGVPMYQIQETDSKYDINIKLENRTETEPYNDNPNTKSYINSILINEFEIITQVKSKIDYYRSTLKSAIAKVLRAPEELIQIHPNKELQQQIRFVLPTDEKTDNIFN